jgi:hypothetical protein
VPPVDDVWVRYRCSRVCFRLELGDAVRQGHRRARRTQNDRFGLAVWVKRPTTDFYRCNVWII